MMMDERNKPPAGPAPSPTPDLTHQAAPPALLRWVPGLAVFRDYRREWLRSDLLAGVSVCVVMIPSVIAYAGLMGLPPNTASTPPSCRCWSIRSSAARGR